jgi:hypothetical protein
VFQPQYGLSNQYIAAANAAVWAYHLGRTLVLPPLLFPRASDAGARAPSAWVPFDALFEPPSFEGLLPGLRAVRGDGALLRTLAPTRVVDVEPAGHLDALTDVFFEQAGWLPEVAKQRRIT